MPESLHYVNKIDKNFMNTYEQAIYSVVTILEDYDSDKRFPVLGFGGIVSNKTSHAFNVNMTDDPHCTGVNGNRV